MIEATESLIDVASLGTAIENIEMVLRVGGAATLALLFGGVSSVIGEKLDTIMGNIVPAGPFKTLFAILGAIPGAIIPFVV